MSGAAREIGGSREHAFLVEGELLTDVGRTLQVKVLSTPAMIAQMEHAATMLALEQLPADQTTVGFEICVKHVAGALEGANCIARATLREVADGRKWRFDVEVREDDRVIGVGTHERRMVGRIPKPA